MPRFDTETKATLAPEAEEVPQRNIPDTWSEELFYNDCYITYRQTSEFIGVWDFDEFLAPHPTKPCELCHRFKQLAYLSADSVEYIRRLSQQGPALTCKNTCRRNGPDGTPPLSSHTDMDTCTCP